MSKQPQLIYIDSHTEFQMVLLRKEEDKHDGWRRARTTYEQAAKKANNQVLGSVRASMTLVHDAIRVRQWNRTGDHEGGLTALS